MIKIVKICSIHGELTLDQVYEEKCNNGLSFVFRCKPCKVDYEIKNKEKRRAQSREYERTKRKRPEGYREMHREKYRKSAREARRRNAEEINAKIREDRKNNPEKYLEYERQNRERNRARFQELNVIRKHKMSYEEYKFLCDNQDGKCAICGKEETRRSRTDGQICRLTIDHNHKTGKIRELLCHNCNIVIGHSKESIEFLKSAIAYLEKHNHVE